MINTVDSLHSEFYEKKRRNLYLLPSYTLRLLALPYSCRTATQKPTPIYVYSILPCFSHRTGYNISTGIYRCSTLDLDTEKFARHFRLSRISADNAFKIMSVHPSHFTPDRGFCKTVCTAKLEIINEKYKYGKESSSFPPCRDISQLSTGQLKNLGVARVPACQTRKASFGEIWATPMSGEDA